MTASAAIPRCGRTQAPLYSPPGERRIAQIPFNRATLKGAPPADRSSPERSSSFQTGTIGHVAHGKVRCSFRLLFLLEDVLHVYVVDVSRRRD